MAKRDHIALAELLAHNGHLRADEAVAIAYGLAPTAVELGGGPFPSLDRVAIRGSDVFVVHGQSHSSAGRGVQWIGALLNMLLAHGQQQSRGDLPVGLKMVVARATGHKFAQPEVPIETGAFPRFSTVDDLLHSLGRFLPPDPPSAVRSVYDRVRRGPAAEEEEIAPEPAAASLTFDDLRMRREAAGITLEQIARTTKVPLPLLESLEKGNVTRWPRGLYARAHLTAYAEQVGIPADEILGLVLDELMRAQPREEPVATGPRWPEDDQSESRMSPLVPTLLVGGAIVMVAFGGSMFRSIRPAVTGTKVQAKTTTDLQRADARTVAAAMEVRTPDAPQPPITASKGDARPPLKQVPAVTRAVAVPQAAGSGNTAVPVTLPAPGSRPEEPAPAAAPPADPARPAEAPLEPGAVAALKEERTRVAAALDDSEKTIGQAEEDQRAVQTLLDNAQSDADAAAFRNRLDELAGQLESLRRTKQRLEEGLRVIDRRIKQ